MSTYLMVLNTHLYAIVRLFIEILSIRTMKENFFFLLLQMLKTEKQVSVL